MSEQGTTPGHRPRVAVVFGGRSGEHAISCVTAAGVLGAIDRDRWDVVPVGVTRTGRWALVEDDPQRWSIQDGRLPEVPADAAPGVLVPLATDDRDLVLVAEGEVPRVLGEVDVVMPLLHGPYGEDGTVQGMLELGDVRYVGAGVLASAVGMDKHFMKLVLAGSGLPIGPYEVLLPRQWATDRAACRERVARLGWPVFVKPARAGSSLGISRVERVGDLDAAVAAAHEHDPKVVVEAALTGREIECAVIGTPGGGPPETSLPGEIVVAGDHAFYDFDAKYLDEASVRLACPADLPADVTAAVRDTAARTFEAVGCEGLARVDVFVTDAGVVVNEINTMPGFTPFSMYPRMWAATGLDYRALVDRLLALALERPTGLR